MAVSPPVTDPDLRALEDETCAVFVHLASVLGFPRSVGQIYGLLFITREPLSLGDIAERLGISVGSTSQGLRLLRSFRAVRAVSRPGDRREQYEADIHFRALLRGFVRERLDPLLGDTAERIQRLHQLRQAPAATRHWDHYENRVETLERWHKQLARITAAAEHLSSLDGLLRRLKP